MATPDRHCGSATSCSRHTTSCAPSDFYRDLGLRPVRRDRVRARIAELELRGGTHLVLVLDPEPDRRRVAPFDLMVDDLDRAPRRARARASTCHRSTRQGHASFTFRDPDGYVVTVNDTHVDGAV